MPCWFEYKDIDGNFICPSHRNKILLQLKEEAEKKVGEMFSLKEVYSLQLPEGACFNKDNVRMSPNHPVCSNEFKVVKTGESRIRLSVAD
jgi:hypothetical protein